MNKKAFTLIEVLLVIAILGIVSAVVVPSVGKFSEINLLNQQSQDVVNNLELVKFKAISGAYAQSQKANWGVVFCPNDEKSKYILVGTSYEDDDEVIDQKEFTLSGGALFNCVADTKILFERFSSAPKGGGDIDISIEKQNLIRIISINGLSGKITVLAQ
jgi:prepilin-type N-terminal cleavage/methylation domain-containing protein